MTASTTVQQVTMNVSNNCEYEGSALEQLVAEKAPVDALFEDVDTRLEYRARVKEPLSYLRNPWNSTSYQSPLRAEAELVKKDRILLAHGKGVLRSKENGSVLYEGDWNIGYRHGHGDALIFQSSSVGSSERTKLLGRYSGQWRVGMRDGQGILMEIDGEKYDGSWKFDGRNGMGTQTLCGGAIYQGYFHDDKRHRIGRLVWPSGKVEDREYEHGQLVSVSALNADELSERLQAMVTLEHELDSAKTALAMSVAQCVICHNNPRQMVAMPCLHLVCCQQCMSAHQTRQQGCPACAQPLTSTLKCLLS